MRTTDYQTPRRVRRAALLLLAGGTASVTVLGISRASDGFVGAGAFLAAIAVAAVSIGIAAEFVAGLISTSAESRWDSTHCGSCSAPKTLIGSIWVCPDCDRIIC